MGGTVFFPLLQARFPVGSPTGPLSDSGGCGTGPWPAGCRGAWLCPGPQLTDTLPQVKGKFKHGGCKALVDEVPGQAALEICVKDPDESADVGVTC